MRSLGKAACREKLKADVEDVTEVHVMGRSRKARILLDRDYVVENQTIAGKTFSQKQPEGSFSQPNGAMCEKMVSWAEKQTRGSRGDLLELYCGNGNFTIPISGNFRRVVATEVRPPVLFMHCFNVLCAPPSLHCCDELSVAAADTVSYTHLTLPTILLV